MADEQFTEVFDCQRAEHLAPVAAEGEEVLRGLNDPSAVDDARRAVQVIGQQVVDRAAAAHGDDDS